MRRQLLAKGRKVCAFDEFSPDVATNRILLSTPYRLALTRGLDAGLRGDLKSLIYRFDGVTPIELGRRVFENVRLNRNNRFYGFVLDVCRIVYENTLIDERTGGFVFSDFTRDERKMNRLFERFLYQFYLLEQREFRVSRENLRWRFEGTESDMALVPKMETDVSLLSPVRKIILEAKYYGETLVTHHGAEKIRSGHLYQLYAYLMNQVTEDPRTRRATGILIYPRIDRDLDLEYSLGEMRVLVKTVDLSAGWREIEKRLLGMIG